MDAGALGHVRLGRLLPRPFSTGLASIIYFHLIAARGATYLALSNYAVPALGVIYGTTFLDKRLSVQAFFALVLILAGIAVANWGMGRRKLGRPGPGAKGLIARAGRGDTLCRRIRAARRRLFPELHLMEDEG